MIFSYLNSFLSKEYYFLIICQFINEAIFQGKGGQTGSQCSIEPFFGPYNGREKRGVCKGGFSISVKNTPKEQLFGGIFRVKRPFLVNLEGKANFYKSRPTAQGSVIKGKIVGATTVDKARDATVTGTISQVGIDRVRKDCWVRS